MRRHWRRSIQIDTTIPLSFSVGVGGRRPDEATVTEHLAFLVMHHKWQLSWFISIIALLFFSSCASSNQTYNPSKKYSPVELQQDLNVAWKTWQKNHPSLYWYNPKDTVDKAFSELEESLTDSLTELQFRNKLAIAAEKIQCGHTSVRLSEAFGKFSAKQKNELSFPLIMKTWGGDSLVVTGNAFRRDSQLIRGTVIKSINGKPVHEIISQMAQLISGDGFNNNFKYQVISNSFPTYYRYAFGLSKQYTFEYIASDGSIQTKLLPSYDPRADTLDKRRITVQKPVQKPSKKELRNFRLLNNRSLSIDTANHLAYMLLNTFSKNKLTKFFRQSFKTLKDQNIPNLVIELRENGGGSISKSTKLARYIAIKPFKIADTAMAVSFNYPYPKYVKNGFWYKVEHWLVSPFRRKDGNYHFHQLEKRTYNPFVKNHYDGQVYIITGGYTFSASTLFINPLKGQKNVTVIGEETGGGAYGNTAINIPDIVLPNTGLRVRLPLYRLVANKNLPHDGRGIQPDIYVPANSIFLKRNLDPKMEKVKQLIQEKKGA